jgi:hypothetical protein
MTSGVRLRWSDVQARFRRDLDSPVIRGRHCLLWTGRPNGRGYGQVTFEGRHWTTHHLMWTRINGAVPEGLQVLHHCDVRLCGEPRHLYVGTHTDNMRDAVSRDRNYKGVRARMVGVSNPSSKLTMRQARRIRAIHRLHPEIRWFDIAIAFGVTRGTISEIIHNRTYREEDL